MIPRSRLEHAAGDGTEPARNQKPANVSLPWSSPSLASFHVVHVQRVAYLTLFCFRCSCPERIVLATRSALVIRRPGDADLGLELPWRAAISGAISYFDLYSTCDRAPGG